MTTEEILALRAAQGWESPLMPLEPGERQLMFFQRGTYEWLMHPDDTLIACLEGVEVEGLLLKPQIIECCPLMNAFLIRVKLPDRNVEFIPTHKALDFDATFVAEQLA